MAIRKVKGLESSFSILPNHTINAPLSWSAKGLLAYLLSKPDDWSVSVAQLINHSKLSSRPTMRDGTYAIINELMEKGYIQRERTNGGGYSKTEYTVSSIPIEQKQLTDNPVMVEPTLQSKELYKENIKDTDNSFPKRLVSVKDLGKDFQQCKDAYEYLSDPDWLYLGKLSIEEWSDCEDAMNSVDFEFGYFDWWADRYRNTFTKKPSLRNILSGTNKMSFDEFYDNTYAK